MCSMSFKPGKCMLYNFIGWCLFFCQLIFLLLDGAYLFQNSHFVEIIPQFLTWLPTLQVGFQNCGKIYAELEKSRLELQINSNSETASIIPGSVLRERWNPVSSDTKGECHSVHFIWVSVLRGLSGKMPQTRVLTIITQTFLQDNVDEQLQLIMVYPKESR